jgi:vacuolar-type H+-ATPase subunit I/STV1
MFSKRPGNGQDESPEPNGTPVVAETLRAVAAAHHRDSDGPKDEEKMSLFWRVFGGTILSIAALVSITLYNSLQSGIAELRAELGRERAAAAGLAKKEDLDKEREARAAFAKKDDVDSRMTKQYERIRAIEAQKADIEALRERVAGNTAAVDAVRKETGAAVEAVKRETAGLELLRERVAAVEALKKEVAGLDAVREKLAALAADLKAAREEVARAQREVEGNKVADLERKAFRDAQARQVDEAIKELQKGVQDCREKLARLEGPGGQPVVGPPAPKAKPAARPEVKPASGTDGTKDGQPAPAGGAKPGPDDDE